MSLLEPWATGPDTAGRRDLQTMFMTVGLLLELAQTDRLYTQHGQRRAHTAWPGALLQTLGFDMNTITLEDPERGGKGTIGVNGRERERERHSM